MYFYCVHIHYSVLEFKKANIKLSGKKGELCMVIIFRLMCIFNFLYYVTLHKFLNTVYFCLHIKNLNIINLNPNEHTWKNMLSIFHIHVRECKEFEA